MQESGYICMTNQIFPILSSKCLKHVQLFDPDLTALILAQNIFSWLAEMNNSREDNIVVQLSTADSSVSVIPLSIRNTGLSEGLPTVWLSTHRLLSTQHLDTDGTCWSHTHKIHVLLVLADIHRHAVHLQFVKIPNSLSVWTHVFPLTNIGFFCLVYTCIQQELKEHMKLMETIPLGPGNVHFKF